MGESLVGCKTSGMATRVASAATAVSSARFREMLGSPEGSLANRPPEFPCRSVPLLGPAGQGPAHHALALLSFPFAPALLSVPFTLEREEGRKVLGAERGVVGILGVAGGTTLHRISGGAIA
jgi:hypothetical protein